MSEKDYYQFLQVPHGASVATVEAAYWDLARKTNAALDADPGLARLMHELNEAYRILGTPQLRRQYDTARGISGDSKRRRRFLWFGRSKSEQPNPQPVAVAVAEPAGPTGYSLPRSSPDDVSPADSEPFAEAPRDDTSPPGRESSGWVRWEMPPVQSIVVSAGVAVIFILALADGADPGLMLILGGVTVFFALFPWRFGRLPAAVAPSERWPEPRPEPRLERRPERRREEEVLQAQILRDSTAAIVARWRQGSGADLDVHQGPSRRDPSSSREDSGTYPSC